MPAFYPDAVAGKVARSRKLDAIVLWTKDVGNCLSHPGLARVVASVPCIVNFTATGLAGTEWEPRVPPLSGQAAALAGLAALLPHGAIRWRFDPIIPTPDWRERFARTKTMLEQTTGAVDEVTVSFPDPYRRAVERVEAAGLDWPVISRGQRTAIIEWMISQFPADGRPHVRLCCEPDLAALPGAGAARCIDAELFDTLYNTRLAALKKDPGQRKHCGCAQSTDTGSYDMLCRHGCLYCYANPE